MNPNVDYNGYAKNTSQPVIDRSTDFNRYSNVDSLGYVIDPTKPAFNSSEHAYGMMGNSGGYELDEDWELSEGAGKILQILFTPLALVLLPAISMLFLEFIVETLFEPLFSFFYYPAFILLIALTAAIPNLNFLIKIESSVERMSRLKIRKWLLVALNYICGYIVSYSLLNPHINNMIQSIWDAIKETTKQSIIGSILAVLFISLLYALRFIIPLFVVPAIQFFVWKGFRKKLLSMKIQGIVGK
ncbi:MULTISPECIES: hypothetical protein [unclassified Paenibacillus]|uniref:hypothetical protein n=1 Tax=unclassified Paenibacillus TaxID=185978 RepID=UPI001AE7F2C4|nr:MULTISPECIES: hypothetical protein [unclassified Paenibacillus]MBP1156728.1 hypothetical protein [Paenibacillus sp. PvP091]MBP1172534.1 hypothetical protein [Paenibacillus sp. PvR098]MBP2438914.1 hypothetical protein [Paenibacillus sp. PvP052]